jgi:hypothetical protein
VLLPLEYRPVALGSRTWRVISGMSPSIPADSNRESKIDQNFKGRGAMVITGEINHEATIRE